MPIFRTLRYKLKPESVEKCRQLLQEYMTLQRQNEPGTLFYFVMQEKDDPTIFMHFGVYEDEAAAEAHGNNAYVKHYADSVFAEAPEPGVLVDYDLIASKNI